MTDGIPVLRRIGLDLDNTVVDYGALVREEIAALGLLPAVPEGGKRAARDALRGLPGGEAQWTLLQARIYGTRMERAVPFAGVRSFLARARQAGLHVAIVSHKTERAAAGGADVNLREAARSWLAANDIAGPAGVPFEAVYFEATRASKTARIASLGLDVFVDDLAEVFADPGFPAGVRKWLFSPDPDPSGAPAAERVFSSWDAIARAVFESDADELTSRKNHEAAGR